MPEILFATWDGGGNVPPAIAIASELQVRGARVRFLGHETQREALTAAGFPFSAYAGARPFDSATPSSLPSVLDVFTGRRLGEGVLAELRRRPADLVVVDCLLLGVLRACAGSGQPYVSLEHLFDGYLRGGWLHGPLGLVGRLKGLRPVAAWRSAAVCLVTSPPSLDPIDRSARSGNVRTVGPALTPVAGHDLAAHEPAVLVSLSTYSYPGMAAALQRILDATASLEARVIVTTGPAIDAGGLQTAANHEVHRFVPHDELMPRVSLVVGHGGHATTMRALAHDLPLVLMPMHPMLDQPLVAKAVARAGAGERVSKKASAETLRPLIERLLGDGPHRAAARRLGSEIRALDGARAGADLIQDVLAGAGAAHRPT